MAIRLSALARFGRLYGDDVLVRGVQHDSRRVVPGDCFAALRGARYDGHDFAAEAVSRGAVAILAERQMPLPVSQLIVENTRQALGPVAAEVYGHPSKRLHAFGVTGTNGKTTTTYLLYHLFGPERSGLIGTVEVRIGAKAEAAERTTPEASDLQRLFAEMLEAGIERVFLEVSSHALVLGRVRAVDFAVGIFTNLTEDHLDFHGTMDAYREAKALLFRGLRPEATAVLNADDDVGVAFAADTKARLRTYGCRSGDVRAEDVHVFPDGLSYRLVAPEGSVDVRVPLTGAFNVYNTLAAATAALAGGLSLATVAERLASFGGVPGRFERIDVGQPFLAVVDYAHTPDGLANVLKAARALTKGRLLVVFGCGGDRDRQKRPLMGSIAAQLADRIYVTSDNPRSEEPDAIIQEILTGIPAGTPVVVEADRRNAIFAAIAEAKAGDVVVVAGKGHEHYQIFRDRVVHFDDREVVREALYARL